MDAALPLHRLDHAQTYLVAWDGDEPLGHAHIAWTGTDVGVPELQDVFVLETRRRQGVATALMAHAERLAAARGHARLSLSYSIGNEAAISLYRRLGYRDAGLGPKHMQETIWIRGRHVEIDETMVYLVKDLPVDSGPARSS